jgi:hypothetical protein
MAKDKAHKNRTKLFAEETYAEQSRSIKAEMMNLNAAIKAHLARAAKEDRASPKAKVLASLRKLIAGLESYEPGKGAGGAE